LEQWCGSPPVLDLAHLGLGADGHTASLVPGDGVLSCSERDVALTGVYQNRRRMTLTYPLLNRSRRILWLATGAAKVPMVRRLLAADGDIPAGRITQANAVLLVDTAAAPVAGSASSG
ncbi:MAG: 6-phosphogluconolactonase, partial [Planctomycetota bacterium]